MRSLSVALEELRKNPYCAPIIREAERRGIAVRPIPEDDGGNYFQLTYRGQVERFCQGQFDSAVGGVSFRLLYNKAASLALLAEAGIPVAETVICDAPEEGVAALERFGEVVVKPSQGSGGQLVRVGITQPEQVRKAIAAIRAEDRTPLVQEHLEGYDNRVLIVGERAFCVQRQPPFMVGDGQHTLRQLIVAWNEKVPVSNRQIRDNASFRRVLKAQGFTLETVLPNRARAVVGELSNTHKGGFAVDYTELACPEAIAVAREACALFSCSFLGVDFVSEDFAETPGKIIEVNPHAGLTLHHQPTFGTSRNVAGAILDHLFPKSR